MVLGGEVAIALQLFPVVAEIGEEISKTARLRGIFTACPLHRGIQGCIGGIGQVQLVVPKRQQALSRVAGDGQAQGVGIVAPLLLFHRTQLSQGWKAMDLGLVNGQSWLGFTDGCACIGLAAAGDHRQAFEQGGSDFGNRTH